MFVEHDASLKHTSSRIFSGLAKSYEKALDYATLYQDRHWKVWAAQRMNGKEGDLVLDVGCGTLLLEERLSRRGCKFIGVDLAPEMIRIGQRKKVPNVALLMNGDAEFLPFPEKSFDSVVSCYVSKYIDVEKFADELARVTKPGAPVVLYDFARPRGALAPILELYIQGGLRVVAFTMNLARRGEACTFSNLPRIIERTDWDSRIVRAMESKGFESLATARLTGGVVFAYWGRRRKSPLSEPGSEELRLR